MVTSEAGLSLEAMWWGKPKLVWGLETARASLCSASSRWVGDGSRVALLRVIALAGEGGRFWAVGPGGHAPPSRKAGLAAPRPGACGARAAVPAERECLWGIPFGFADPLGPSTVTDETLQEVEGSSPLQVVIGTVDAQ